MERAVAVARSATSARAGLRQLSVSSSRCVHQFVGTTLPGAWVQGLNNRTPPERVLLGAERRGPTPIQPWALPGVDHSRYSVGIKRDDLTGTMTSGNKIRKLEYLFAEAIQQGCDTVITCGGVQSNHCRATAAAARELGLDCHLLLRSDCSDEADLASIAQNGNLLLDLLLGATCHVVPKVPYLTGLLPRMERLVAELETLGQSSYIIPVGGSNLTGLWGYIKAFEELMEQGLADNFDDVVVAVGSGGTACGLAVANHLAGSPVRVHAFSVSDHKGYFHHHIDQTLEELGLLGSINSRGIINIVDGYKGAGYGLSQPHELAYIAEVAQSTGIVLDSTYTGKAVVGLRDLLSGAAAPGTLAGNRVLFLHTGGLFGLFDGRLDATSMFKEKLKFMG